MKQYFVYIVTNKNKTVLYTGITNNLQRRLSEHYAKANEEKTTSFAGKYNAYNLLYFEVYGNAREAIAREKEIKGWRRSKKEALINSTNPDWKFLNE